MRPRSWIAIFALCAGAVLVALGFVTDTVLDLETRAVAHEQRTRRRDQQQERIRSALWRLDSWLLPLLAREGARPYFEYLAYYPQECAYTRYLSALEKGDVLVASPLLLGATAPFRLFFQVDGEGRFSSPQLPIGNLLDLAQMTCSNAEQPFPPSERAVDLATVQGLVVPTDVRTIVAAAEALEARTGAPSPAAAATDGDERGQGEWQARQQQTRTTKLSAKNEALVSNRAPDLLNVTPAERVDVGSLVPLWLGGMEPELFFFRRVVAGEQELLQGIWCRWSDLRATLLASIAELLPDADLVPLRELGANFRPEETTALATIPARLVAPELPTLTASDGSEFERRWSAAQSTLLVAWSAVVVALIGGFLLVRSSVALGERRRRFVSAVTHELRTPLTTFRMYSEMLAHGMVSEPKQRQGYLETLEQQSGRLATLVENVLAYARLEEGRGRARREAVTVEALLERHRRLLSDHARSGGFSWNETIAPAAAAAARRKLTTDVDAVGQILFNLVDNAVKYARGSDTRLELEVDVAGGELLVALRDHGPGIAPAQRRRIFAPFERGDRHGDPAPGVGLGLALSRNLARDLGGELRLVAAQGEGARFELRLPLDPASG